MPQGSELLAVAVLLGVAIGLVLRRSPTRRAKAVVVAIGLLLIALGLLAYVLRAR